MQTLTKLLKLSRQEWSLLICGLFFLAISSAALLIYPYTIKRLIDEAINHKDLTQLNIAAGIALVVFTIQSI